MSEVGTEVKEIEPIELPKDKAVGVDDFFSSDESRDSDIAGFVQRMKTPKEEIPQPSPMVDEEPQPDPETLKQEAEEKQVAEWLDYTPEQYQTAEFVLMQIDKGIAFVTSLVTGEQMEKYQIRLKETPTRKQEAELAAALVKKYQMSLSIEFMLLMAIVMAYAPVIATARKDLKAQKVEPIPTTQHNRPPQRPIK